MHVRQVLGSRLLVYKTRKDGPVLRQPVLTQERRNDDNVLKEIRELGEKGPPPASDYFTFDNHVLSSMDNRADSKSGDNYESFSENIVFEQMQAPSYSLIDTNLENNVFVQSMRFVDDVIFSFVSPNIFKVVTPLIASSMILSSFLIPSPINEIVLLALAAPMSVCVAFFLTECFKQRNW